MGWSFNPFGFQKNLALMQNLVTSYAEELLMKVFEIDPHENAENSVELGETSVSKC